MLRRRCFSIVFCLTAAPWASAGSAEPVPGLILPLHEVQVGTAVSGILQELLVEEGDTVESGTVLAKLEDSVEKLEVERAERVLEKTKFDHEAAAKLIAENIGTREAALTKRIEFDLARIQLETAQVRLKQRTITAPLQGIVVKRLKEPGEALLLNETVVEIVHIRQVYAQFYIEPAEALALKIGTRKTITVPAAAMPGKIEGEVVFIDPRVDAESGLFRVKLKVDNTALRLKAGMRAEAVFGKS